MSHPFVIVIMLRITNRCTTYICSGVVPCNIQRPTQEALRLSSTSHRPSCKYSFMRTLLVDTFFPLPLSRLVSFFNPTLRPGHPLESDGGSPSRSRSSWEVSTTVNSTPSTRKYRRTTTIDLRPTETFKRSRFRKRFLPTVDAQCRRNCLRSPYSGYKGFPLPITSYRQ